MLAAKFECSRPSSLVYSLKGSHRAVFQMPACMRLSRASIKDARTEWLRADVLFAQAPRNPINGSQCLRPDAGWLHIRQLKHSMGCRRAIPAIQRGDQRDETAMMGRQSRKIPMLQTTQAIYVKHRLGRSASSVGPADGLLLQTPTSL